jgi:PAS domain S-box-containing protein
MVEREQPIILCVDDEALGLYFRKLILERDGYRVITAGNAQEALRLFSQELPSLVVTDHLLGRDMGTTMAAKMKAQSPGVPILVLSGTTDLPQGLEHADGFISKTDGPAQFLAKVRDMLANCRPKLSAASQEPETDAAAEEFLRPGSANSNALLAAIVEGSADAILSKTLDGIITSWNKAAERMYGYTAEEATGQPVSMLLPPDRPHEVEEIMQRLRRGERLEHFETRRLTKDGRILIVSLTISPIRDSRGRIVGASTITRDITQLRLTEEALRNSEKLAVAGRMAGTVAHEINNPLEAVSNVLYLLENSESLDNTTRQFVWAAQEELKRISQITKLTLGFYRGERRETDVRITELIDNVLTLYGRKIESLGIKLETRYEGNTTVRGDEGELRQVFSNLVVNAVDAMNESGDSLVIHVYETRDWRNPGRRGVRASIHDNGRGIAPQHRRHLFEPFYTTKGDKGTGIGLWVSHGIVQKHGGSLRFRSRMDGKRSGTSFTVFLPSKPDISDR